MTVQPHELTACLIPRFRVASTGAIFQAPDAGTV